MKTFQDSKAFLQSKSKNGNIHESIVYTEIAKLFAAVEYFQKEADRLKKQNELYHSLQESASFVFLDGMADRPLADCEVAIVTHHNKMIDKIKQKNITESNKASLFDAIKSESGYKNNPAHYADKAENLLKYAIDAAFLDESGDLEPNTNIGISEILSEMDVYQLGTKYIRTLALKECNIDLTDNEQAIYLRALTYLYGTNVFKKELDRMAEDVISYFKNGESRLSSRYYWGQFFHFLEKNNIQPYGNLNLSSDALQEHYYALQQFNVVKG